MKLNSSPLRHYACCNRYMLVTSSEPNRNSVGQLVANLKFNYDAMFPENLEYKETVRNAVLKNTGSRQKKSQQSKCKKRLKLSIALIKDFLLLNILDYIISPVLLFQEKFRLTLCHCGRSTNNGKKSAVTATNLDLHQANKKN